MNRFAYVTPESDESSCSRKICVATGGIPGEDRRGEPPSNWGVSGFTNNPFSKLKPDGTKR